jgi:hypothetical protein
MASASEYIALPGLCVPLAPFLLLLDLERRGFTIAIDGDDLVVRPKGALTDDDRRRLRQWKAHVRALVDCLMPKVH